jgi:hypothetical protein
VSICSRCGNPVEFRYINGKSIPMHFEGGCVGYNSSVNDYSGYNTCYESTSFGTNCPECGDRVFLIRHNGGCVWLDPPLGWPWYKHGCFSPEENQSGVSRSTLACIDHEETSHEKLEIGVIKRTWVEPNKNYTDIVFEIGENESHEVKVKNNAGFLLGKLCVLNEEAEEIWPFYEPEYKFILHDPKKHKYVIPLPIVKTKKKTNYSILNKKNVVRVNCRVCGCKLQKKNEAKHLRKSHGELSKKSFKQKKHEESISCRVCGCKLNKKNEAKHMRNSHGELPKKSLKQEKKEESISCRVCGCKLNKKNEAKHLRKVHGQS